MKMLMAAILLAAAPQQNVSISRQAAVDPVSTRRSEIAAKLTPSAKEKLRLAASPLKTAPNIEALSRLAIAQTFPDQKLAESDVEVLMFYLLGEASAATKDELKSIGDEIRKMNDQKSDLRKLVEATTQAGVTATPSLSKVQAVAPKDYYRAPAALPAGAEAAQIAQRLSDLGMMSGSNQIRLQNLTSQKSKFDSAMSNMLLKVANTDLSVVQNLK